MARSTTAGTVAWAVALVGGAGTLMPPLIRAVRQGRAPDEHQAMAVGHAYAQLEAADVPLDLLERRAGSILVLPIKGVDWSDQGRPQQVTSTLARAGKRPTSPLTTAAGRDHASPRGLAYARQALAP